MAAPSCSCVKIIGAPPSGVGRSSLLSSCARKRLRPAAGAAEVPAAYGVSGRLLELNGRLCQEPGLLREDPLSRGWLAIVGPLNDAEVRALRARSEPL